MTYTLVLLRHGESEWNAKNLFTGWVDVPLTDKGRAEAVRGGELLKDAGVLPDVVHTSLQRRAINTAALALEKLPAASPFWALSPKLPSAALAAAGKGAESAAFREALVKENPDREVRANALFGQLAAASRATKRMPAGQTA